MSLKKSSPPESKANRYSVRVLDRAINILLILSDGKTRTLQEICEATRLSSSTAYRFLATFARYGFVDKDARNRYSLGLSCLELARSYFESNDLRKVALPEIEALRDEVKETVHLAILNEMEVVYLEKLPGLHAIGLMGSRVGGRAPAYCTGLGKILLAFSDPSEVRSYFLSHPLQRFTDKTITDLESLERELAEIRRRGYALDRGEHEIEVRCVAAPIFDMSGRAVGALSISGPAGRLEPLEQNQILIEKTCATAKNISKKLGYHPRGPERQLKTEKGVRE
ncbi:MAG: IclR family transcriptional regulator [bacterium]